MTLEEKQEECVNKILLSYGVRPNSDPELKEMLKVAYEEGCKAGAQEMIDSAREKFLEGHNQVGHA